MPTIAEEPLEEPARAVVDEEVRPRFILGAPWGALALLVILWIEIWAWLATDHDYYLPDFFRPLTVLVVTIFVASGLLPHPRVRKWLRLGTTFVVISGLLLETFSALRPPSGGGRVVRSEDALLRYHYKPGRAIQAGGSETTVNEFGLWDSDYTIPKPDDVYRVLLLGGSMGNDGSIAFEDRYHAQLERALTDAHPGDKRIEAINVSCEGYNTLQQVRLLERVGLQYEPDLVVVAYQMSDPFLQDGGSRRFGNSRFLFRYLLPMNSLVRGSKCSLFAPLYDNYGYHVVVHNSLERLHLLKRLHGFDAMVAVMPVVEEFDDAQCVELYDQVMKTATEVGLEAIRVPDAFVGMPAAQFAKPNAPGDLTHPNVAGHTLIAKVLERRIRERLGKSQP